MVGRETAYSKVNESPEIILVVTVDRLANK